MKLTGKAVAPGVDLKPEGHCVACPPSVVDGGKYEVVAECGTTIATLPVETVKALMTANGRSDANTKSATTIVDFVEAKGGRKNALVSAAGHLSRLPAYLAEPMLRGLNDELPGGPLSKRDVDEVQKSRAGWAAEQPSLDPADWPEPKAIRAELPSPMKCDPFALLPKACAEWVVEEAELKSCSPDGLCMSLVICAGSVLSPMVAQQKEHDSDFNSASSMAGGLLATSGSIKSSQIKPPTRLVKRQEAREEAALEARRSEWKAQQILSKKKGELLNKRLDDALKADDVPTAECIAVELAALASPPEPKGHLWWVNNATTEALVGRLADSSGRGTLLIQDEGSTFFAVNEKDGRQGDTELYMELIDAEDSYKSIRVKHGEQRLRLALSIVCTSTPEKWLRVMTSALHAHGNNGLLPRFQLMVYPEPRPYPLVDRPRKDGLYDAVAEIFDYLADVKPADVGAQMRGPNPLAPSIKFHPAAQKVRTAWHLRLRDERIPAAEIDNPLLASHLSKQPRTFGALALILHMVERRRGPILADTAERAVVWCDYLESHARRIYALLDVASVGTAAMVARRLAEGKLADGFTSKQLVDKGWTGIRLASDAAPVLSTLVDRGWLRPFEKHGAEGGRPTTYYAINPRIATHTATAVAPLPVKPRAPPPKKRGLHVEVDGKVVPLKKAAKAAVIPKKPGR